MGHYTNVKAILEAALDRYDVEYLVRLAEHDPIRFADDVAFLVTRLFACRSTIEQQKLRGQIMEEIQQHEVDQLEMDLG